MIQPLIQSKAALAELSLADPVVLVAADENYVRPLAVTLHSAASALGPERQLHVILLDGGISESSLEGLRETLVGLPVGISTLPISAAETRDLVTSHHITHTAYFRLLAGRLLPRELEKVIYLDSDVLVQEDLTELWELPLGNHYCLAASDIACPFVDAYEALRCQPEIAASIPYLAAISPIPNWKALGLDGAAPYFNSGVMVLNLQRWREESIEQRLLACLRDNASHVWCWDQYALNVVFADHWGPLPARWNQGVHIFEYPDEQHSPIPLDEFRQMRDNPAVIHFTTEFKPWKYEPYHPLRDQFFDELDETAWRGWRPDKPPFQLRTWWDRQAVKWIRKWIIGYRKSRLWWRHA